MRVKSTFAISAAVAAVAASPAAAVIGVPAAAVLMSGPTATSVGIGGAVCGGAGIGVFFSLHKQKLWERVLAGGGSAGVCGGVAYLLYRRHIQSQRMVDPDGPRAGSSTATTTTVQLSKQIAADGWALLAPPAPAAPGQETARVDRFYTDAVNRADWASKYPRSWAEADLERMQEIASSAMDGNLPGAMPDGYKISDDYALMQIGALHQHLVKQVTGAINPLVVRRNNDHLPRLQRHLEWLNGPVKALADRAPK